MGKKLTTEEYIEQLKDKGIWDRYRSLEEYQGADKPILHQCLKCSHEWKIKPNHIKSGHGCPACAGNYVPTNEEYIEQLKDKGIWDRYRPLEEYVNNSTPISHQCLKCKHEWKIRPNDIKRGHGCPNCAGQYRPTNEEYQQEIFDFGYRPLEEYQGAHTPILHQCLKCKHEWKAQPTNIKSGKGCPNCAGKYRSTNEEYIEQLKEKGLWNRYRPLEEYQGAYEPILHQCLKCNHKWKARPANIKNGHGCPACANTNKAENLVNDYLESTYPNQFQTQKKFNDLVGFNGGQLSFDFYLEIGSNRYLIEIQGIQHYQPSNWNPDYFHTQQEHDVRKYKYARDHDYIYVAIPNTCSTAEKESVIVPFLQTAIWLSETFGVKSHGYHFETCLESSSHTQEIMQTALF